MSDQGNLNESLLKFLQQQDNKAAYKKKRTIVLIVIGVLVVVAIALYLYYKNEIMCYICRTPVLSRLFCPIRNCVVDFNQTNQYQKEYEDRVGDADEGFLPSEYKNYCGTLSKLQECSASMDDFQKYMCMTDKERHDALPPSNNDIKHPNLRSLCTRKQTFGNACEFAAFVQLV